MLMVMAFMIALLQVLKPPTLIDIAANSLWPSSTYGIDSDTTSYEKWSCGWQRCLPERSVQRDAERRFTVGYHQNVSD
jgi:hypothetical protein